MGKPCRAARYPVMPDEASCEPILTSGTRGPAFAITGRPKDTGSETGGESRTSIPHRVP